MKKYLVHTPLSDGYDKGGAAKRIKPDSVIERDPDDQETIDLLACKAISEVAGQDATAVKAAKAAVGSAETDEEKAKREASEAAAAAAAKKAAAEKAAAKAPASKAK